MTEARARVADRYTLDALIGRGSYGAVWRSHDPRLGRPVALKLLHALDDESLRRFVREARMLARVRDAHVVTVHDAGTAPEGPYLVMDLVEGPTLADQIRGGTRLTPDDALAVAIDIARGLAAMHAQGIIHRDLKPANVVRTAAGVVIVDFGLAKPLVVRPDEVITTTGGGGTVGFSAPEQFDPALVTDHRADLYALGVTLFLTLTGRLPYQADNAVTMLLKQSTERAPLLSTVWGEGAWPRMDALLHTLLAPQAAERPADVVWVLREMEAMAEARRVALAPTVPPQGRRFDPTSGADAAPEVGAAPVTSAIARPWMAWTAAIAVALVGALAWVRPWASARARPGPRGDLVMTAVEGDRRTSQHLAITGDAGRVSLGTGPGALEYRAHPRGLEVRAGDARWTLVEEARTASVAIAGRAPVFLRYVARAR